jgi:hypothetical protein
MLDHRTVRCTGVIGVEKLLGPSNLTKRINVRLTLAPRQQVRHAVHQLVPLDLRSTFEAKIPKPVIINNIYYFEEAKADNWLRELAGLPPLPIDPDAPVRLIRASTLADRRGCQRVTIKRDVERTYGKLIESAKPASAKRPLETVE